MKIEFYQKNFKLILFTKIQAQISQKIISKFLFHPSQKIIHNPIQDYELKFKIQNFGSPS